MSFTGRSSGQSQYEIYSGPLVKHDVRNGEIKIVAEKCKHQGNNFISSRVAVNVRRSALNLSRHPTTFSSQRGPSKNRFPPFACGLIREVCSMPNPRPFPMHANYLPCEPSFFFTVTCMSMHTCDVLCYQPAHAEKTGQGRYHFLCLVSFNRMSGASGNHPSCSLYSERKFRFLPKIHHLASAVPLYPIQ